MIYNSDWLVEYYSITIKNLNILTIIETKNKIEKLN